MEIFRLFYISTADELVTSEVVNDLVELVNKANPQREVSGELAFESAIFGQVLEGPEHSVTELLDLIRQDPRHTNLTVLKTGKFPERIYPLGMQLRFEDPYLPLVRSFPEWCASPRSEQFPLQTITSYDIQNRPALLRAGT